MKTKPRGSRVGAVSRRVVIAGVGASAAAAMPLRLGRAQAQRLRIGLLVPRSGFQAQLGLECQRGADVAADVLPDRGFPAYELIEGDTETSVQIARAQTEKLIERGCNVMVGAFDSGQTVAIAQVCEQKGVPLVVNVAAAPQITESGFKTVFRNFPTGPMVARDAFLLQKEVFARAGKAPSSAVMLHVNDTFGTTQRDATVKMIDSFGMPYKIADTIAYDPATRDMSGEVRRAKAGGAELLWVISRLNDSLLLTQELVKQRWVPMGIVSTGPAYNEDTYMRTLGKLSDDVISIAPWLDPNKAMSKIFLAGFAKRFGDRGVSLNAIHTFEALVIALDAYKRAGSAEPGKLIEALRTTDIKENLAVGPGVKFDAKGQNVDTMNSALQNRAGKLVTVAPQAAADGAPIWPIRAWDKR